MGLISRVSSRTYRNNMGKKGPNSKGYKGPRPGQPVKKAKTTTSLKPKPKNFQKPKFSKPHPKIDLLKLGGTEEDVKLLAGIDEENAETLEFNEKAENMTSLA